MAFPFQWDPAVPQGDVESARLLDNRIREVKAQLADLLGIPLGQNLTAGPVLLGPDGTIVSDLRLKKATPRVRVRGTELDAREWALAESGGAVLVQENTGTEAVPVWTTRLTVPAGGGAPILPSGLSVGDVTGLDRVGGAVALANSLGPATLYSATIPGGTLGTNRGVRLTMFGVLRNTTGATRDLPRLKITFGGATVGHFWGLGLVSATTIRGWSLILDLMARGATNAQGATGRLLVTGPLDPEVAVWSGPASNSFGHHAGLALDSTQDQTLEVSATHEVADLQLITQRHAARLERR